VIKINWFWDPKSYSHKKCCSKNMNVNNKDVKSNTVISEKKQINKRTLPVLREVNWHKGKLQRWEGWRREGIIRKSNHFA